MLGVVDWPEHSASSARRKPVAWGRKRKVDMMVTQSTEHRPSRLPAAPEANTPVQKEKDLVIMVFINIRILVVASLL